MIKISFNIPKEVYEAPSSTLDKFGDVKDNNREYFIAKEAFLNNNGSSYTVHFLSNCSIDNPAQYEVICVRAFGEDNRHLAFLLKCKV